MRNIRKRARLALLASVALIAPALAQDAKISGRKGPENPRQAQKPVDAVIHDKLKTLTTLRPSSSKDGETLRRAVLDLTGASLTAEQLKRISPNTLNELQYRVAFSPQQCGACHGNNTPKGAATCPRLGVAYLPAQVTTDFAYPLAGINGNVSLHYDTSLQPQNALPAVLGLALKPADETLRAQVKALKDGGLVVTEVKPGSLAAKSGIRVYDVLLAAAGKPLTAATDLEAQTKTAKGQLPVAVVRDGAQLAMTIDLFVANAESEKPSFWLGIGIADADDTLRAHLKMAKSQGVVITSVEPETPAAKAGLRQHDVIVALDGKPAITTQELTKQIQAIGERAAPINLIREGQAIQLVVQPAKRPKQQTVATWQVPSIQLSTNELNWYSAIKDDKSLSGVRFIGPDSVYVTVQPATVEAAAATVQNSVKDVQELIVQTHQLEQKLQKLQQQLERQAKPAEASQPASGAAPKK